MLDSSHSLSYYFLEVNLAVRILKILNPPPTVAFERKPGTAILLVLDSWVAQKSHLQLPIAVVRRREVD